MPICCLRMQLSLAVWCLRCRQARLQPYMHEAVAKCCLVQKRLYITRRLPKCGLCAEGQDHPPSPITRTVCWTLHLSTQGRVAVWSSWHRENHVGQGLSRPSSNHCLLHHPALRTAMCSQKTCSPALAIHKWRTHVQHTIRLHITRKCCVCLQGIAISPVHPMHGHPHGQASATMCVTTGSQKKSYRSILQMPARIPWAFQPCSFTAGAALER